MLSLLLFTLIGCGEKEEESKDTATVVEASEENQKKLIKII